MIEKVLLQPSEYARLAVDVASDKLASDVVMLDIKEISSFADYFIILTAESSRQLRNLSEEIEKALKGAGIGLHHREGTPNSGWMLLDYGDVIIHMFGPEEREFYDLEGAWSRAIEVVRLL
ncbi:MAG: ribosome silencing factor [Chloroflexi bacterium]|nr:ribosome silencing factor [Chloroflexota bacterium]